MKKLFIPASFMVLMAVSCTQAPEADKAQAGEEQQAEAMTGTAYTVDTVASTVGWVGTKVNGRHTGIFKLSSGTLSVKDGTISGGNFVINIGSLTVTDLTGEDKAKLEGHLSSPDFFEVATYPTAKFEITGVEAFDSTKHQSVLAGATHMISGNLTLKNETKNVTFPAVVNMTENGINAKADFQIDRTTWGMNYKGPNNPQDWFIRKDVNIALDIAATK